MNKRIKRVVWVAKWQASEKFGKRLRENFVRNIKMFLEGVQRIRIWLEERKGGKCKWEFVERK